MSQPGMTQPSFRASRAMSSPPEGMTALTALVAEREKDFGVVAELRDADGPMLDRALDAVRAFIIARGLILFGGLAIDCALRLKGGRIYPDAQRPDYDFMSFRSVDDAYDLADELANAGFVGVGAVRGIHVQTMKVRVDFRWVADVGHVPRDVYDTIPTFEYQGMRVVHPDFQRMDMHLAFCFPYNAPPREDVFHRWRKDLKRINLYERYYPIEPARSPQKGLAARAVAAAGPAPPMVQARLAVPLTARGGDGPLTVALHGFAAYAVLRAALRDVLGRAIPSAAPELAIEFPEDDPRVVRVETPAGDAVTFASPQPVAAVAALPEPATWYDAYMDTCPESVRVGSAHVLSTAGRLLAAAAVPVSATRVARVVTPQYLLLWLLYQAHRAAGTDEATLYRTYYAHTLTILRDAEAAYAAAMAAEPDATRRAGLMDAFAASPFAPTTAVIGTTNTDAAYSIRVADAADKLRETPPAQLGVRPDIGELIRGLPARGYYPGGNKPRPTFVYEGCALFRRSGQPKAGAPPL